MFLPFWVFLTTNNSGMNKVFCVGSQTKTVACGDSEIIDIQSVTIAYVENTNQCIEEYIIPVIEIIEPPCKRSSKNARHTDGSEVYKRYNFIFASPPRNRIHGTFVTFTRSYFYSWALRRN